MKKIEIKAVSEPNWKEGLVIILLLYYVVKTDNRIINIDALILSAILFLNFIGKFYLLVRYNLLNYGKKILIEFDDHKNVDFSLQGLKGREPFNKITVKNIPLYNLYYVKFSNGNIDLPSKPLILNANELALLQLSLELTYNVRSGGID